MRQKICAMKRFFQLITGLEETVYEKFGLTLTEAMVLCSVSGGYAVAHDLTTEVRLSLSRLSRVLSALEKKGLVERQRSVVDKRNLINKPSLQGEQLIQRINSEGIELPKELEFVLEALPQGV
jgi:DNA-binding MarR family transcriptional regulator